MACCAITTMQSSCWRQAVGRYTSQASQNACTLVWAKTDWLTLRISSTFRRKWPSSQSKHPRMTAVSPCCLNTMSSQLSCAPPPMHRSGIEPTSMMRATRTCLPNNEYRNISKSATCSEHACACYLFHAIKWLQYPVCFIMFGRFCFIV